MRYEQILFIALMTLLISSVIKCNYAYSNPIQLFAEQEKFELNEKNLWFKTKTLVNSPRFNQLIALERDANQVTSTLAGRGAFLTKIEIKNVDQHQVSQFVDLHANFLDVGVAYWQSHDQHNQDKRVNSDLVKAKKIAEFGQLSGTNIKVAHSQAFRLTLQPEETGILWIYIQAKHFPTPVVVSFISQADFYNKQVVVNSMTAMSIGIMLMLTLIAFFIYCRMKQLVIIACAGYIGLHGLGWFAASGLLGHLMSVTQINPVYLGMLIFPFAIAFASQFTKLLFNCHIEYIKLAKWFNAISISCLCLGCLMWILPFYISFVISHIIAAIWVPLSIGTGVFMLGKKDFRAKYYLWGNLFYGTSLIFYVVAHVQHIDLLVPPELVVLVALSVDCICILLSLSEWLQIQQKEYHRSYALSRIDPLTKLGNRYLLNEKLANLTKPYCLAFIDFDGFKAINDTFGHDKGDKFLIKSAQIMQEKLNGEGSIFRTGGDEFIWLIAIEDTQQTDLLINRITHLLQQTDLALQDAGWQSAGLSFGIATSLETVNLSECLSLADKRMYLQKQSKVS